MNTEPIFAALSHPVRRQVVALLLNGDQTAGVIARQFSAIGRSAVSEHLGVLRQARLVTETKSGRERIYSLNAEPLAELRNWLAPYESYWRSNLAKLATQLEQEEK
jgi:DNA-binding transcriptional ArsR family regulator